MIDNISKEKKMTQPYLNIEMFVHLCFWLLYWQQRYEIFKGSPHEYVMKCGTKTYGILCICVEKWSHGIYREINGSR